MDGWATWILFPPPNQIFFSLQANFNLWTSSCFPWAFTQAKFFLCKGKDKPGLGWIRMRLKSHKGIFLVPTYLHRWLICYRMALRGWTPSISGTVFINALPRWNISETRLASVFTSRGLALEIAQSKVVREGSYSWEIICKGYILPSSVVLNVFFPPSDSLSSSKLKWGKYIIAS